MLHIPAASLPRTDDMSTPRPSTQRASPLFDRLRSDTALAHRDLESRLDLDSDALDAVRYLQLLRNFRRAVGAYESITAAVLPPALVPMFAARHKTALLDADLRYFGDAEREREDDLREMRGILHGDPLAAIGAMYVFEGSTLGGAVVSRHLERHIGLPTLQGRSYFMPYPGRTAAMWREFKARVEEVVGDDALRPFDVILDAAGATFSWLARSLPRAG